VHVLSHGSDSGISLGKDLLNADTLDKHSALLSSWEQYMDKDADILFYACDVADSAEGREFLGALATITQADIAASNDTTGHKSLGGDWDLEYKHGAIEAAVIADKAQQQQWRIALGTFADSLDLPTYSHSSGSVDWSDNPWQESEGGSVSGAVSGDIQIDFHDFRIGLIIQGGDSAINSISRAVPFPEDATNARLSFDMVKHHLHTEDDYVDLQFKNPGGNWVTIDTFTSPDSGKTPYAYSIDQGYVTDQFEFRFITGADMDGGARVFIENVEISFDSAASLKASNLNQNHNYIEDDESFPLNNIVIDPVPANTQITVTITPSSAAAGQFSSSAGSTDTGTGIWQFSGTRDQVNTVLAALVYLPSDDFDQNHSASVEISSPGLSTIQGTIDFSVTAVNDAPTFSVSPLQSSFLQGMASSSLFDNVSFDTIESGQVLQNIVIDVSGISNPGQESLLLLGDSILLQPGSDTSEAGFSYTVVAGANPGDFRLYLNIDAGAGAAANALIESLAYTHSGVDSGNYTHGSRSITISELVDNGGFSNGGADTVSGSWTANVDVPPPVPVVGDITESISEDQASLTSNFNLTANDSGNIEYTITSSISPSLGQLNNNGDGTFTFIPGADQQALAEGETRQLQFTYTATDRSAAAAGTSEAATVTITLVGKNDGPVLSGTHGSEYTEDSTLSLSGLSVSDIDGDNLVVHIKLSDHEAGDISATGISLTQENPGHWSFSGDQAQIQALLDNLQYVPASNYNQDIQLEVVITDGMDQQKVEQTVQGVAVNDHVQGQLNLILQGQQLNQKILLVDTSALSDADGIGSIEYQWLRDGEIIEGATSESYEPGTSDFGAEISVSVTLTDEEGNEEVLFSPIYTHLLPESNEPLEEKETPADTASEENNKAEPEQSSSEEKTPSTSAGLEVAEQDNDGNENAAIDPSILTYVGDVITVELPSVSLEFSSMTPVDIDPPTQSSISPLAGYRSVLTDSFASASSYQVELTSKDAQDHFDLARDQLHNDTTVIQAAVGGVFGTSATLSIGYVMWLTRSGILLSTILSSLPAWQVVDPLPVLGSVVAGDEDQESLHDIVDNTQAAQEISKNDTPISQQ
jgi:VCBS repeat-containing protein